MHRKHHEDAGLRIAQAAMSEAAGRGCGNHRLAAIEDVRRARKAYRQSLGHDDASYAEAERLLQEELDRNSHTPARGVPHSITVD